MMRNPSLLLGVAIGLFGEDAKMTIRAAVRYLIKGTTDGIRGDIVQEIISIVRQTVKFLTNPIHSTKMRPADSPCSRAGAAPVRWWCKKRAAGWDYPAAAGFKMCEMPARCENITQGH
jgi:hypothetical protein